MDGGRQPGGESVQTPRGERPSPPRAAVVYNPTKVDRTLLEALLEAEEQRRGWASTFWVATTEDDPGNGAARAALGAAPSLVLVAGGDGTVRAVAEELQHTDIPLALVPSGTGNLLARNLGMDISSLEQAVEVAFTGEDRRIDVATAELEREDGAPTRTAFLVMAGIGLDASMAENTSARLKKRLGWIAYVDPIARSVLGNRQFRMRYRVDAGRPMTVRAHTVIVGNCGTLTANILLLPDAVVDDGLLDVVVFRPERARGWARIGARLAVHGILHRSRRGRRIMAGSTDLPGLRYVQARELQGRFAPQPVQLDGDSFGPVSGIRVSVRRQALTLRVPRSAPPSPGELEGSGDPS